jgi:hypothetical protein
MAAMVTSARLADCCELRRYSLGTSPLDIFDGFAVASGGTVRTCRRCYHQDWYNTRVIINGHDIDFGEDPRIFVHHGVAHVAACVYLVGYGFRNHLIEFTSNATWRRWLLVVPSSIDPGKNWSPITFPDGRLGFVQQFSPLVLLREVRREAGAMVLEALTYDGIPFEAGQGGFCAHRGGTNGIPVGDEIFGIGHTTRVEAADGGDRVIHRPFAWWLRPHLGQVRVGAVEYDWDPEFNVVDPTSLIRHPDGRIEMYTAEFYRSAIDPGGVGRSCRYSVVLN